MSYFYFTINNIKCNKSKELFVFEEGFNLAIAYFRKKVKEMDGYLFVTPEYNRSVPAAMKNALDVASRPYGSSGWDKKVGAVVSASTGAPGAFGANHHLRQSLVFLNVLTMQQPEAYLGNVTSFINEDGSITNEGTLGFFQTIVDGFVALTEQFYK